MFRAGVTVWRVLETEETQQEKFYQGGQAGAGLNRVTIVER
jgi:hypothetical protein